MTDGMLTVRFTIPGKPMPWQRAGLRGQRHYTPQDTTDYQNAVRRAAKLAGCPVFGGRVMLVLRIFFPDNRVRDDDNVEKSIRDALQPKRATKRRAALPAVAWVNDHCVKEVHRIVDVDASNPRVEVTITGLRASAIEEARPQRRKRMKMPKGMGQLRMVLAPSVYPPAR